MKFRDINKFLFATLTALSALFFAAVTHADQLRTNVYGSSSSELTSIDVALAAGHTVTLLIENDTGKLAGAENIDVDGTLFDVTFAEGDCIAIYNGCDEAADFELTSEQEALAAAQALIDQVFLNIPEGDFDTIADLTFGCDTAEPCSSQIDFEPFDSQFILDIVLSINFPGTLDFVFTSSAFGPDFDSGTDDEVTNAVFTLSPTSVTEPSVLVLFAAGLFGLAMSARRRRKPS